MRWIASDSCTAASKGMGGEPVEVTTSDRRRRRLQGAATLLPRSGRHREARPARDRRLPRSRQHRQHIATRTREESSSNRSRLLDTVRAYAKAPIDLTPFANVRRWQAEIAARPATERAAALAQRVNPDAGKPMSAEEKKVLFGQGRA